MMKYWIILIVCMIVFACSKDKKIDICGNIEGLTDGTRVTLTLTATHQRLEPMAETTVKNGIYRFDEELEEPRCFCVRFFEPDSNKYIGQYHLMLAPGDEVIVKGTMENPEIIGSEIHKEYVEKFLVPRGKLDREFSEMRKKYSEVEKLRTDARRAKDNEEVKRIEESEEYQAYLEAEKEAFKRYREERNRVATENRDTYWGPMLYLMHTAYLVQDDEKLYNMFSEEAKNSFYGQCFKRELFGPSGMAPDFKAKDVDGKEYSLQGLLDGKHYFLLDFWASWCGPCRKFVPTLKELAAKYQDKGLTVVSISCDKKHEDWKKALEQEQMPWLNLIDESGIGKTFGVSSIPSVFLIGPDGKILFGKQSGDNVVQKLRVIFGE